MPKATDTNIMNRRALLTMAVTVPAAAAVAAVPMAAAAPADHAHVVKVAIDRIADQLLTVPIATIAENNEHIVFAVRLPREALGPDLDLVGLAADPKLGADLAEMMAARGLRP